MKKRKVRKTISGLLLLIVIMVGCGGKPVTEASSVPVEEEPTPAQTETETEASEEPSKEETSKEETFEEEISEEETPEEEPVILSSCIIFDNEEYCEKGETLCDKDTFILEIAFNLPEGTKIYSPFDAVVHVDKTNLLYGQESPMIDVREWPMGEVMHEFSFRDVIPNEELLRELEQGSERVIDIIEEEYPEGPVIRKRIKVRKGELLGQTTKNISWVFPELDREYNFLILSFNTRNLPPFTHENRPDFFVDKEFLHKFFPYIECGE